MEAVFKNNYWLTLTAEQEKKFIKGIRNALILYGIFFLSVTFFPNQEIPKASPLSPTAVQVKFILPPASPKVIPTPQPTFPPNIQPNIEKVFEKKLETIESVPTQVTSRKITKTTSEKIQTVEKKSQSAQAATLGLQNIKNQLNALKSRPINSQPTQTIAAITNNLQQANNNLIPQTLTHNSSAIVNANYSSEVVNDTIGHEGKEIALSKPIQNIATNQTKRSSALKKTVSNRSEESVRINFEKSKTAFFTMYNRALRQDASLQGKVVFKVTIESSGQVSKCIISSSDLPDKDLQNKLIAKIKGMNFGVMSGDAVTISYSIDFFPG
ncbi:MAG: AgmX/PglI C-terminal domain-containing protein [Pseudomonadota bacterium]